MTSILLFLESVPSAYFASAFILCRVVLFRRHGLIFNPIRDARLQWPIYKALLSGAVPAIVLSQLLLSVFPSMRSVSHWLMSLGILASAVLAHRHLLTEVENAKKWNIGLVILVVVILAMIGTVSYQLPEAGVRH